MPDLSAIPIPRGVPRGHRLLRRRQPVPLTTALTIALGVIWIIDGLLQLQPSQFSSRFALGIEMNAIHQAGLPGCKLKC